MTNPETLSPLAQQEFLNVQNAVGYLGRGDLLLFPVGSEVAVYHPEPLHPSVNGGADKNELVLASTYSDIAAFTTESSQFIGTQIDTSAYAVPENAQSLLDNLFAAAASQNKFMGIMSLPNVSRENSYYVVFVEPDTTVEDKQIISRKDDGSYPIVTGFDGGSHSLYDALLLANNSLQQ